MWKKPLTKEQILLKASPEPNTGCWLWTESDNGRGYGRVCRGNKMQQAHRVFYELFKGPIPEDAELDHLCRVKCCVNPDHLDPVDHRTNVKRGDAGAATTARQRAKTHCPRGHAYEGRNVMISKLGRRKCRTCSQERDRARHPIKHQRRKEKAAALRAHREHFAEID